MFLELPTHEIMQKIYTLRGIQVMVDKDLAKLYQVETKNLKKAVRRNIKRFPQDFMFEMTQDENKTLRFQIGTSKVNHEKNSIELRGGNRVSSFAFTEAGVAMLSSVLKSERAIQVNISIIRAFIQLRRDKFTETSEMREVQPIQEQLEELKDQLKQVAYQVRKITGSQESLSNHTTPSKDLNPRSQHSIEVIKNEVAAYFGIRRTTLESEGRKKAVTTPRQIAMYLARKHLGMSFSQIGENLGGKNHSTVIHGYQKIHAHLETEPSLARKIHEIEDRLSFGGFKNQQSPEQIT